MKHTILKTVKKSTIATILFLIVYIPINNLNSFLDGNYGDLAVHRASAYVTMPKFSPFINTLQEDIFSKKSELRSLYSNYQLYFGMNAIQYPLNRDNYLGINPAYHLDYA